MRLSPGVLAAITMSFDVWHGLHVVEAMEAFMLLAAGGRRITLKTTCLGAAAVDAGRRISGVSTRARAAGERNAGAVLSPESTKEIPGKMHHRRHLLIVHTEHVFPCLLQPLSCVLLRRA